MLKRMLLSAIMLMTIIGCQNEAPSMPKEIPKNFSFSVSFGVGGKM